MKLLEVDPTKTNNSVDRGEVGLEKTRADIATRSGNGRLSGAGGQSEGQLPCFSCISMLWLRTSEESLSPFTLARMPLSGHDLPAANRATSNTTPLPVTPAQSELGGP